MTKNSVESKVTSTPESASRFDDAPALRRVTSEALLAGLRELVIEHSGQEYRLRMTSNGKLILTK